MQDDIDIKTVASYGAKTSTFLFKCIKFNSPAITSKFITSESLLRQMTFYLFSNEFFSMSIELFLS